MLPDRALAEIEDQVTSLQDTMNHGRGSGSAAIRLFATPPAEVDLICRLALAQYLNLRDSTLSDLVREAVLTSSPPPERRTAAPQREQWLVVKRALETIKIVDPTCGHGHFLLGMLRVLEQVERRAARALGLEEDSPAQRHTIAMRNLYGVEVERSALALAALRLRHAIGARTAPLTLHLACGDSLVERGGFSWDACFPEIVEQGGFDLVVGNPPYVRHELIDDPLDQLPKGEYRRLAREAVYHRLGHFFGWNDRCDVVARPLDGRSDLCVLFTFFGFSLLRPGGVLAFVLPAAALEARYGRQLREFLESSAENSAVLESSRQRSFLSGVNTVILVSTRRAQSSPEASPLRHIRVHDAWSNQNMAALSRAASPAPHRRPYQFDRFALRLLERLDGRLTTLGRLGRLRYPVKTGINRFFYPDAETITRFGIEEKFCRHIVRSPRAVDKIALNPADVRSLLFVCADSLDLLDTHGKVGALAYIRWGAAQTTARGMPWPLVPSVQGREHWYAVPVPATADILCPRFFDRRFFFAAPRAPLLEDQTFYGLILSSRSAFWRTAVAAMLNCSLTYLFVETFGRSSLGDGVRQYALCDMAALPAVDPGTLSPEALARVSRAYRPLSRRHIMPVDEEMRQPDRKALDAAVADALCIKGSEMAMARQALVGLTGRRLERARSIR